MRARACVHALGGVRVFGVRVFVVRMFGVRVFVVRTFDVLLFVVQTFVNSGLQNVYKTGANSRAKVWQMGVYSLVERLKERPTDWSTKMRYSYNNRSSVKNYHKKIREGFERFHSMNAQTRVMGFNDTHDANITVLQFVSYDTNIMQVTINHATNRFTVVCNENPLDWSCSTSRQLARWLYESRYLPFDLAILRTAYENCRSVTPDVSRYEWHFITFEFRSSDAFNRVWR